MGFRFCVVLKSGHPEISNGGFGTRKWLRMTASNSSHDSNAYWYHCSCRVDGWIHSTYILGRKRFHGYFHDPGTTTSIYIHTASSIKCLRVRYYQYFQDIFKHDSWGVSLKGESETPKNTKTPSLQCSGHCEPWPLPPGGSRVELVQRTTWGKIEERSMSWHPLSLLTIMWKVNVMRKVQLFQLKQWIMDLVCLKYRSTITCTLYKYIYI